MTFLCDYLSLCGVVSSLQSWLLHYSIMPCSYFIMSRCYFIMSCGYFIMWFVHYVMWFRFYVLLTSLPI